LFVQIERPFLITAFDYSITIGNGNNHHHLPLRNNPKITVTLEPKKTAEKILFTCFLDAKQRKEQEKKKRKKRMASTPSDTRYSSIYDFQESLIRKIDSSAVITPSSLTSLITEK
jgi:hypothetical protein